MEAERSTAPGRLLPHRPIEEEPSRYRIPLLAALFVAALLLRLPGLDGGLWFDEIWMLVDFVRKPLATSLTSYTSDNHHPLYTLLAWASVRIFGEHPWSLRLFACLFGAASVSALHPFAARVAGARTALFASALLAVSYHHVFFSQDARGYTAMLFFALVASHAFLARKPVLQGIALALASWAHLTGVFIALAQIGVWALAKRRDRATSSAPLKGVLLGGAASLALHAPLLPQMLDFFLTRKNSYAAEAQWNSPLWTLTEAARSLGLGLGPGLVAIAVGAVVAVVGLRRIWRRDRDAAFLCVLPALLCALALVALGRNLWPRSFFFAAGFAALVAVEGFFAVLDRLSTRAANVLAGLALVPCAALLPVREWSLPKQDFAGARDWVLAVKSEHDATMTVGLATFPYAAYYGGGFQPVDSREELDAALAGKDGGWVITTFPIYLRSRRPDLADALDRRGDEIARFRGSVGDGDVVVLHVK